LRAARQGRRRKSSVTLHLTYASRRCGWTVGLLDADLYGPDTPVMLSLKHVNWRALDVLLIDLPSGTADLQQAATCACPAASRR